MDIFNIIMGLVGIAAFAFAIWSHLKTREEKEPQCYYKTYRDIVKLSEAGKLRILYDGIDVDKVSTSYIFFWNKGRKPIKKEDIPTPLEITFQDTSNIKILDYKVVKVSREVINFSARQCQEEVIEIEFDFLDKDDGAVIEVKHTGNTDVKPVIRGTILQVPKGIMTKEFTGENLSRKSTWQKMKAFF